MLVPETVYQSGWRDKHCSRCDSISQLQSCSI